MALAGSRLRAHATRARRPSFVRASRLLPPPIRLRVALTETRLYVVDLASERLRQSELCSKHPLMLRERRNRDGTPLEGAACLQRVQPFLGCQVARRGEGAHLRLGDVSVSAPQRVERRESGALWLAQGGRHEAWVREPWVRP